MSKQEVKIPLIEMWMVLCHFPIDIITFLYSVVVPGNQEYYSKPNLNLSRSGRCKESGKDVLKLSSSPWIIFRNTLT